jgi:hypothetical protein
MTDLFISFKSIDARNLIENYFHKNNKKVIFVKEIDEYDGTDKYGPKGILWTLYVVEELSDEDYIFYDFHWEDWGRSCYYEPQFSYSQYEIDGEVHLSSVDNRNLHLISTINYYIDTFIPSLEDKKRLKLLQDKIKEKISEIKDQYISVISNDASNIIGNLFNKQGKKIIFAKEEIVPDGFTSSPITGRPIPESYVFDLIIIEGSSLSDGDYTLYYYHFDDDNKVSTLPKDPNFTRYFLIEQVQLSHINERHFYLINKIYNYSDLFKKKNKLFFDIIKEKYSLIHPKI